MRKRILVIDDEGTIRKLFIAVLKDTPYRVDTANSGEQGIELEQKTKCDLIFLDLKMPDLNGVETLRRLWELDPGVPVYIITAFHKDFLDELGSAAEDGISFEILHKPFGADEIKLIVRTVLDRMQIDELLKLMVDKGATDLHLKVPSPPVLRINGMLIPQEDLPPVIVKDIEFMFEQVTIQEQKDAFVRERELDFAYSVPGLARFRVSALRQRDTVSLAFRLVSIKAPSIDELGLPKICKELILQPNGLIVVTGPSGSGKSTTLAAMINYLNENKMRNVITIEDPIEYLFRDQKCIIHQRELGTDTRSFSTALIHALRHDPDVIVIGEMRDLSTITTAITAAETGHLVLGTLHAIDAAQSIDRLVDVFPATQQGQIRLQLSQVLQAVLSQRLLPRIAGGRIAAFEIMIVNSVIRSLVRDEKLFEINPCIEMSTGAGMQTMEQAVADLVRRNIVSQEEAMMQISGPMGLQQLLQNGAPLLKRE
ncbi:Protein-glutamate methylesterase/protein-glutamine glutaminase [subsurface metagenome]